MAGMAGMPRNLVNELRGDVMHEVIDIYNHIDNKTLKVSLPGAYTTIWDLRNQFTGTFRYAVTHGIF